MVEIIPRMLRRVFLTVPPLDFLENERISCEHCRPNLLSSLPFSQPSSNIFALRVYLAILVTNPSPKEIQLFLPKTDRVEQYLILKVLIL